jgi:hypothetical protein
LVRFGSFHYCTKVDAKQAELYPLTQKFAFKVALEFFATNAPDLLHWTQNSFLGRFGPFHYCTKVDAKLAELAPLTPKFA